MKDSPRKELGQFVSSGYLRSVLEMHRNDLSFEAIDLLVRIALNYCEPRKSRRKLKTR